MAYETDALSVSSFYDNLKAGGEDIMMWTDTRKVNLNQKVISEYLAFLEQAEKSNATIEKYAGIIERFIHFLEGEELSKKVVIAFKEKLVSDGYRPRTVNAMLCAINGFLDYLGQCDLQVKGLRLQSNTFRENDRTLSKDEYKRLLKVACSNERIYMILRTICSTGIRISELQHFTIEAVREGSVCIRCKGKIRKILLPVELQKELLKYCRHKKIMSGIIFRTRNGKPLDRCYIWSEMKKLAVKAGVPKEKVFPHNLRKLFATTFYQLGKNIANLADVLGHSSIDTTRIYVMTTEKEARHWLDRLDLL